ncbi:MAG: diguanylate cyclase [Alphaproteobacteria bacterium]|nr:diguanylate cyclase [Alphaproteobacteria bacterium]MBN9497015.1 diguanylate cyclase [Alphaproteobacteria bacterium]
MMLRIAGFRHYSILAVAIAACLALAAGETLRILEQRERTEGNARTYLENVALTLTQTVEGVFTTAEAAVLLTAGLVARRGIESSADRELSQILVSLAHGSRSIRNIRVLDRQGKVLASSAMELPGSVDFSSREYFHYHANSGDRAPRIGLPVVGMQVPSWLIPVTIGLFDGAGAFVGLVVVSIDMQYFLRQLERIDIGRDGSIALLTLNGALLVRRPFVASEMARDFSQSELYRERLSRAPADTYVLLSPIDGKRRYFSYRKSDNSPLVVSVAISVDEILEPWIRESWRSATVVALVSLVLIGFATAAFVMLRRSDRNAEAARAVEARRITDLANLDALTGLANRRAGLDLLRDQIAKAEASGRRVAILLIDLDKFKAINDTHGHRAGDAVLIETAARLRQSTREKDALARLGGDEFLVGLGDLEDAAMAGKLAERMIAILLTPVVFEGKELAAGCSIGISVYPDDARDLPLLIQYADEAMYVAKSRGRGTIRSYADINTV